MSRFIFWTGAINILLGVSSLFPSISSAISSIQPDSRFYVWLPGILVSYLGVLLILASRDLPNRASIVYWEGILRLAGFAVATRYGFFGEFGVGLGLVGIYDLVVGLTYLVGLPITLNRNVIALLLDRKD